MQVLRGRFLDSLEHDQSFFGSAIDISQGLGDVDSWFIQRLCDAGTGTYRYGTRDSDSAVQNAARADIYVITDNDRAGYQAPARSGAVVNIPMRPDLRPDPSESREIPDPDAFTHLDIMIAR
jgi:hypothetical protein